MTKRECTNVSTVMNSKCLQWCMPLDAVPQFLNGAGMVISCGNSMWKIGTDPTSNSNGTCEDLNSVTANYTFVDACSEHFDYKYQFTVIPQIYKDSLFCEAPEATACVARCMPCAAAEGNLTTDANGDSCDTCAPCLKYGECLVGGEGSPGATDPPTSVFGDEKSAAGPTANSVLVTAAAAVGVVLLQTSFFLA